MHFYSTIKGNLQLSNIEEQSKQLLITENSYCEVVTVESWVLLKF